MRNYSHVFSLLTSIPRLNKGAILVAVVAGSIALNHFQFANTYTTIWYTKRTFIRKVIDKSQKIKTKWCRDEEINSHPIITSLFQSKKKLKSSRFNTMDMTLYKFETVKSASKIWRIGLYIKLNYKNTPSGSKTDLLSFSSLSFWSFLLDGFCFIWNKVYFFFHN